MNVTGELDIALLLSDAKNYFTGCVYMISDKNFVWDWSQQFDRKRIPFWLRLYKTESLFILFTRQSKLLLFSPLRSQVFCLTVSSNSEKGFRVKRVLPFTQGGTGTGRIPLLLQQSDLTLQKWYKSIGLLGHCTHNNPIGYEK